MIVSKETRSRYDTHNHVSSFLPVLVIKSVLFLLQGKIQGKLPELKAIVQYSGKVVEDHTNVYNVSSTAISLYVVC